MKRNLFRLATVMRVRRIQHDIELGRLTQARTELGEARLHEAQRIQEYRTATRPDGSAVSSQQFLRERSKFERLGDQVTVAVQQVSLRRDDECLRHQDWSIAAQRVSALDRLHDRHNAEHQSALDAEEVLDADERTTQRRFRADLPANRAPLDHTISDRSKSSQVA